MSIAKVLLEIITNSPDGLLVHCPNVNELCRDLHEETGVMVIPKRQLDHYESPKLDYYGDPYISKRINTRKYLLKI